MLIFIGDKTYICFEEYNGVKFSQASSKNLGIENDAKFSSFEECREVVAKHHNVNVSKLEIGHGTVRS